MIFWKALNRHKARIPPLTGRFRYGLLRSFHPSSTAFQPVLNSPQYSPELFEYTSGRWLYNESKRLSERRLVFNVDELKKAAAKSVGRSIEDVKSLRKLAEGGFNRVFEISMKDGLSVLARLPYPFAVPRRFALASEVATMDFLRAHGIPVPRVLGYSVEKNSVGSEYMLMEKLPGKVLGETWFDLSADRRNKVLYDIVNIETKLFNIDLPANGSLYYARDLDTSIPRVKIANSDNDFCVGPYASERWWYGERGSLDIDRGPHEDMTRALQAPAKKELAWIQAYGRPRYPAERYHRESLEYKRQNPADHAKSLRDYLLIAPHLVSADSQLNLPVLRHPDMHPNNIFVNEVFEITSLIDWQHSVALPTCIAANIPNLFQNYNDEVSQSLVEPKLPDGIECMEETERSKVLEQYRRRHVHFAYVYFTQEFNPRHHAALRAQPSLLQSKIYYHAGYPWDGLNTDLQYDLLKSTQHWQGIAAPGPDGTIPTCPISRTEKEAEKIQALDDEHHDMKLTMEELHEALGIASDGWVPSERLDDVKKLVDEFKEKRLASVLDGPELEITRKHWPFDDYDEDE